MYTVGSRQPASRYLYGQGEISRTIMTPNAASEITKARSSTEGWTRIYQVKGPVGSTARRRARALVPGRIVLRGLGELSDTTKTVLVAAGGLLAGGLIGYMAGRKKRR